MYNNERLLFSIKFIYIVLNLFCFHVEKKNCSHRMTLSCLGGLCMSSMRRFFTPKLNILGSTGSQSKFLSLDPDVQCLQKNIISVEKFIIDSTHDYKCFYVVLHMHKRGAELELSV